MPRGRGAGETLSAQPTLYHSLKNAVADTDLPPDPHPKRPPAAPQAHQADFPRNPLKTLRKIRPPICIELSPFGAQ
jgi:hypothetical protein